MLKVLLVDDEPFILQGLKVLIDWNAEGYEVVGAVRTGQEAIDYLKENPVDLVMTDIKMPVMSGIELLEEVRRDQISDAYFIILSGYNDFAYAQQAVRYHCIDYILKPVEKEQLIAVLQKVAAMSEKKEIRRKDRQEMEAAYLARNLIACLNGKYDRKNLDYIRNHMQISEGVRYVDIELLLPEMIVRMAWPEKSKESFTEPAASGSVKMEIMLFSMFHMTKKAMISDLFTAITWHPNRK